MSRSARYTVILTVVTLFTALAAFGGWWYARASAPVNGPIILISIDALRADRLPAYGYRGVRTPAIDALAANGIVFERAYAHVPQTLPAHAALLTGRLPFENGVRDGVGFSLKPSERTLAEMLGDRGYATAGLVSSYLLRKDSGLAQGFAFFDAQMTRGVEELPAMTRDSLATEQMAEHWLDSSGTSRAFLFLHLSELHRPYGAEPAAPSSQYDQNLAKEDAAVGALVRYLKSHQLYDRSTIVLVADHGEGLGDHGESAHGLLAYEEDLRVPLIVKLPGAEQAGRRIKDPVQHIDIVPTILDLAKAPVPGNLRGRSLTSLFSGNNRQVTPIYGESLYGYYHFGWGEITTITDGRYRYISAPDPELYDLESDPQQQHNLIATHKDVVAALTAALKNTGTATPPARAEAVAGPVRERLEAFGYVGVSDAPRSTATPADAKDGVDVVERYRAATEDAVTGRWQEALDGYRALAQSQPELLDVWMHAGDAALRLERFDAAADAFKHAATQAPLRSDAQLGAAFALLRLRKLDEAKQHAQAVLDLPQAVAADQSTAHEVMARVALLRRELEMAREEAALAERADPSRPVVAFVEGRMAFDRKHFGDVVDSLQEALTKAEGAHDSPLVHDLRLLTADTLAALQRYPEAEYLFEQELKAAPHSTRARTGLGAVYKATGRPAEAAALAH